MLLTLLLIAPAVSANTSMRTLDSADQPALNMIVLLDARPTGQCLKASVTGARCLPADTFYSKDQHLASFHHINWVLGTIGLAYEDEVLIFADRDVDRDVVAGLLFLAGHLNVSRWTGTIGELQNQLGKRPGQSRAVTRTLIYHGTTRDEFIALADDIPALQQAGWILSTEPPPKGQMAAGLIVTAHSPVIAVAEFASLLAEGQLPLMVVIDAGVVK